MRRPLLLLVLAAALASAAQAAAALQPVRRTFGELTIPRVRAGTIQVPAQHASGRIRVIVTLTLPPLAQASLANRASALAFGAVRRLDVQSGSSRAYLARLDAAQRRAAAVLRREIPEARVQERYRIILDGMTVSVPVRRLQRLERLGFVAKIYPSLRYALALNRSPAIIGAPALWDTTGARGEGIKIGVVDDGIDQGNSFFDPAGFSYPPGFPKGNTVYTTPKVIVARSFPGPGAGAAGQLPVDRRTSFHGTHVAGIAAGDAGTIATAGPDHPLVTGISGVAPRAWLGNYRVFNVPTPLGFNVAETPEIVAAFESAVADGMNVINFSGGGPQTDPATDAMTEAVKNVAAAGVVPVIAAGNDRDEFGLGSVGAPGTTPDAITVAAISNTHVFGRALTVVSPSGPSLAEIPFVPGRGGVPDSWSTADQRIVDVGTLVGSDGKPVERHICGPTGNLNAPATTLAAHSLDGDIALVSRGLCTFVSKSERLRGAGAVGMILVDNRPGEANFIPVETAVPAGMVSDLDGARLRDALAATGGRGVIRVGRNQLEIDTNRGGIPTSFSAAGLTAFGHELKPDISAPGAQILSSTLAEFAGAPFAVFDGTSMATPHIAGAAALLLQLHPTWTARQVKSALMSTAGPAYSDTSRTAEAPVLIEGAGIANLPSAAAPQIFTDPQSLSFRDLDVNRGAASRSLLATITDAGGGAGTWQVELRPQSASPGASVSVPGSITLGPGGNATVNVVAQAAAGAAVGDDYGFVVLRRGDVTRRIPYAFSVIRPKLAGVQPIPLKQVQIGTTAEGIDRASVYRWPTAPFGPPPSFTGPSVDEDGAEKVYVTDLKRKAVNLGVSVVLASEASLIDPWLLGSLDENNVQGYAGTPVNVNSLMFDYRVDVGAAAAVFPQPGRFYVVVDSGHDPFTGRSLAGRYLLRSWVDDLKPPAVKLITTRVAAGRPTIALRVLDSQSGVDPLSLVIGYGRVLVGAAAYDPVSGLTVIPLPSQAPELQSGRSQVLLLASDYQEAKNVNTIGPNVMPNTTIRAVQLEVVEGPTVSWLAPDANTCAAARTRLAVVASDTSPISSTTFYDGKRKIGSVKTNVAGIYALDWATKGAAKGKHVLRAVVRDGAGKTAAAGRLVRICAK